MGNASEPRARPPVVDAVRYWLDRTSERDARVRAAAIHMLCPCRLKANHAEVWERLLGMVDDPDPRVRAGVLHTLADGSPRERAGDVLRAIEGMRNDLDPAIRRRVRGLLAQYRRTGRINVL